VGVDLIDGGNRRGPIDAIGARLSSVPFTPAKVAAALRAA
jgi:hypothetical protein